MASACSSRAAVSRLPGLSLTHNLSFLRFVVASADPRTGEPTGLFTALYALERAGRLADHELDWFREQERWFNEHLPRPERLARSDRSGAHPAAILWFKASALEYVSRMRALVALLAEKDVPVQVLSTTRPGYVVYEDDAQVAAEPFRGEQ